MTKKTTQTWTVNFIIDKTRFLGKLEVGIESIRIFAEYNMSVFDSSPPDMFVQQDNIMVCIITPEKLVSAVPKKSFFNKRIILQVQSQEWGTREIILDYGMLSINKMYQAISQFMDQREAHAVSE